MADINYKKADSDSYDGIKTKVKYCKSELGIQSGRFIYEGEEYMVDYTMTYNVNMNNKGTPFVVGSKPPELTSHLKIKTLLIKEWLFVIMMIFCSSLCKAQNIIKINGREYRMISKSKDSSAYDLMTFSSTKDTLFLSHVRKTNPQPKKKPADPVIQQIYIYKGKVVHRDWARWYIETPGTRFSSIEGKQYKVDKCLFIAVDLNEISHRK